MYWGESSTTRKRRQPTREDGPSEGSGKGNGGADKEGDKSLQDEPAVFLGRGGGMIEVATDARGTLVSLAADLVAQVRKPTLNRFGRRNPQQCGLWLETILTNGILATPFPWE